jgi:hypothetical protein
MKALTNEKSAARKSKAVAKTTTPNKAGKTNQRAPKAKAEGAPVAPRTPDVAPEAVSAKPKATRGKKTPTADTKKDRPRATSKTAQLVEMLKRTGGATLEEMCTKFGWLPHTTRAMMSAGGSLTKKHGLIVTSEKFGAERRYSIKV